MPMHDWKRADRDVYHDFHTSWIVEIRRALNHGILPRGYFALAEKSTGAVIPDVVTLQHWAGSNGAGKKRPVRGGRGLSESAPRVRYTAEIPVGRVKAPERRIVIQR